MNNISASTYDPYAGWGIIVTLSMSDGRIFADVENHGAKYTKEITFDNTYDAELWARGQFGPTVTIRFKKKD